MNLKHFIPGLALALLAAAPSQADDDKPAKAENIPSVVTVQVGALKLATLHRYIHGFGTIEPAPATSNAPSADSVLSAPQAGVIAKIAVVEGQHVEKGDLLFELNSGTTTLESAIQQLERQKTLYAQQNTSLKNLQDAETQLALLQVKAPLPGTATHVNVKAGQAVDSTTILAEVMDLDRLVVNAEIPVAEARDLKTGCAAAVLTDPPVSSEISFVGATVNTNNDTILARVMLPKNSGCRPGQFVRVQIVTAAHTNCLAAPAESLVTDDDGKSVIALVKGDEAAQTAVQTGFREDGWVEIEADGLKPGDAVVTVGAYGLPDKTKLRVQNPSAPK